MDSNSIINKTQQILYKIQIKLSDLNIGFNLEVNAKHNDNFINNINQNYSKCISKKNK